MPLSQFLLLILSIIQDTKGLVNSVKRAESTKIMEKKRKIPFHIFIWEPISPPPDEETSGLKQIGLDNSPKSDYNGLCV